MITVSRERILGLVLAAALLATSLVIPASHAAAADADGPEPGPAGPIGSSGR